MGRKQNPTFGDTLCWRHRAFCPCRITAAHLLREEMCCPSGTSSSPGLSGTHPQLQEGSSGHASSSTQGAGLNPSQQQAGPALLGKEDLFYKSSCDQNTKGLFLCNHLSFVSVLMLQPLLWVFYLFWLCNNCPSSEN